MTQEQHPAHMQVYAPGWYQFIAGAKSPEGEVTKNVANALYSDQVLE